VADQIPIGHDFIFPKFGERVLRVATIRPLIYWRLNPSIETMPLMTKSDTLVLVKWQLLHKACWEGDSDEVARLLEAGADPNQIAPTDWRQSPLGRTLEFRITSPRHEGHVETVRILLHNGADPTLRSTYLDMSPLELATFCGLEPAVRLLQNFPATTPHPTGMTDLWLACASRLGEPNALESVNHELANPLNVNPIWRKATPLMMAAGHAAHFAVCDRLLSAGADPNTGTSILHAACDWHFEQLIPALKYLSRAGWKVNSRDTAGQTALHKAAFLGYSTAVKTLLNIGADPNMRDSSGRTALDLARQWNKPGVVKLLARAA
jgi:ankyrin repeat protein